MTAQQVAVAVDLDDDGVVEQAIEQSGGHQYERGRAARQDALPDSARTASPANARELTPCCAARECVQSAITGHASPSIRTCHPLLP